MGYYYMDITSKNGELKGNIANNPVFTTPSSHFNVPSKANGGNFLSPAGQGFGIDLGVTAVIYDRLKIGASVVNIGSILYKSNTYQVTDTTIHSLKFDPSTADGFNKTVFWKPTSSFVAKLPTMLRMGTSLTLFENKMEIGADVIIPLNTSAGNLNTAIFAVGGDVFLKRWFKVSTGTSFGGNYANNIYTYSTHVCVPLGFTLIAGENGGWEVGFSTRDIVSLIDMNGKSPLYSGGMCLLRFRL